MLLMSLFNNFGGAQNDRGDSSLSYSQFIESVKAGQVQQVIIDEHIVKALRNKINIASQVLGEDLKDWIK